MAPSGGSIFERYFGIRWILASVTRLVILILLQSGDTNAAAVAKQKYYMDSKSDCFNIGFLDLPRNQVTYVTVHAQTGLSSALSCILQFNPKESGDTLRMWFERDAFIGDCDVSLTMSMSNSDRFTLGCRSTSSTPEMEAVDGRGTLKFQRGNLGSTSYGFSVGIQAVRTQDPAGPGDTSTGDVGLIVGIVAAAVVSIVLLLVLCVCCYRKKKRDADFKVQGTTSQANAAFENGKMNPNYNGGSPSSEKRLLVKNNSDYDAEDAGVKPKSALERFGPTPARRSDRPNGNKDESNDPRRSPVLNDLRNNPQFRKSLTDRGAGGDSSESSVSYNSNGVPLPPKLPPVPRSPQRSPSPQRKGEKIAGIFRARPTSSSSEIAKELEGERTEEDSQNEFVPSPRKDEKADTRHVLRPNRGERKPTLAEERRRMKEEDSLRSEEDERRGRNRDRYRRDEEEREREDERERKRREEERDRQRRKEEEEEEREEEERRRKKKEKERARRRKREEEEEDEERERKERRRREKERDKEDERLEGRFKKSASGRRSKGKGPRMGRSKSTSNALEEMEDQYQRSRSKSPSSVRSLNFIEDDDDDDLDSNYMPFKRAGSKTSLYASRSSLYGRRRKNSMGDTLSMSSYAYDDLDSRYGDFDRRGLSMSRREKDKMFKSTGELEMHGATAQVVREVATQTNSSKAVYVYGRKTLAKSRPGKMYSRGCQAGRTRRDSTGSARSGRSSRMRKSKSTESLRKRSRSRNLDESFDSSDDRRSHKSRSRRNLDESYDSSDNRSRRHRSRSRNLDYSDDDDDRRSRKGKPRARPRKSTGTASVDLSDSDGGKSGAASSVAPSSYMPPQPANPYGPQYIPVMFPPQPGMPYQPGAPGGPPMMPGIAMHNVQPPQGGPPPIGPKPPIAPKPKKSKWDELVEMTDKEKHRHRNHPPDSPTESMMTSVYSHPPANGAVHQQNYYAPPSYTTAQRYPDPNSTISSAYPDSSGMPLSGRGGQRHFNYTPSESEI